MQSFSYSTLVLVTHPSAHLKLRNELAAKIGSA